MTDSPEPTSEAVPAPHPAWVGGSEADIPASAEATFWTSAVCANPICHVTNDLISDDMPTVMTCWVCQRQTNLTTSPPTLVPLPEPGPDDEVRAP